MSKVMNRKAVVWIRLISVCQMSQFSDEEFVIEHSDPLDALADITCPLLSIHHPWE
jgi:hypothetical protein